MTKVNQGHEQANIPLCADLVKGQGQHSPPAGVLGKPYYQEMPSFILKNPQPFELSSGVILPSDPSCLQTEPMLPLRGRWEDAKSSSLAAPISEAQLQK